jgi:hypothetical protein
MKKPTKHRTHLFSPHTDQCIYCGKSAQDDAIENSPCVPLNQNVVKPMQPRKPRRMQMARSNRSAVILT